MTKNLSASGRRSKPTMNRNTTQQLEPVKQISVAKQIDLPRPSETIEMKQLQVQQVNPIAQALQ